MNECLQKCIEKSGCKSVIYGWSSESGVTYYKACMLLDKLKSDVTANKFAV